MYKVSQEEYLAMFKQITEEMYELTKRKNKDYTGGIDDAFRNFTMIEEISRGGVTTEQGFFTRIMDKIMRISTFISKNDFEVKDEKIEDTLLDLCVYTLLFLCYIRSKQSVHISNQEQEEEVIM